MHAHLYTHVFIPQTVVLTASTHLYVQFAFDVSGRTWQALQTHFGIATAQTAMVNDSRFIEAASNIALA